MDFTSYVGFRMIIGFFFFLIPSIIADCCRMFGWPRSRFSLAFALCTIFAFISGNCSRYRKIIKMKYIL